jgi:predicted Zn-dependent protease
MGLVGILVLLSAGVFPGAAWARTGDRILDAMSEELDRSREALQMDGFAAPYFISYAVRDIDRSYVSAKHGALFQSMDVRNRFANVDVRIGDYDLDSSEDPEDFFSQKQKYIPNTMAPVEDSEDALRRVLWLLGDFKYKAALMSFLNVKAQTVNDPKERTSGSLSREKPLRMLESPAARKIDRKEWEKVIRRVSRVALDYPDLFDSSIEFNATRLTRRFVNTEGSLVRTVDDYYQVLAVAVTRATDGVLLQDTVVWYGRTLADMPSEAQIIQGLRKKMDRLVQLRQAPVLDPVTVPVLLSSEATGVFFHETVGHRLEGHRQEGEEEGQTFRGHLGQRILPEFIDMHDDPTVATFRGLSLNGHYRVDDEASPGAKASLVKDGILKGFLMSRKPIEGFDNSNGHGRSDGFQRPTGRMATLFIEGRNPVGGERIEEMLLEEVRRQGKPYGLIIESIAGGATNTSSYGFQAFKGVPRVAWRVDAETGEKTLVRGFEIVGTPLSSIARILATSDRYDVFNGYCGAESGSVPVSTVAPEMLFAELELQRAQEGKERPPVLPPPAVSGPVVTGGRR